MKLSKIIMMALILVPFIWAPSASYALNVGDTAPMFTGNSTQGKVASAELLGQKNIVLALYFAIFTPV